MCSISGGCARIRNCRKRSSPLSSPPVPGSSLRQQRWIGVAGDSFAFWFSKYEARDCPKNSTILPLSPLVAGNFRFDTGQNLRAGVEWAFADSWTAKVEWLYVNLGNGNVNCINTTCTGFSGGPAIPVSVGLTENLIRAGVNYKFNW